MLADQFRPVRRGNNVLVRASGCWRGGRTVRRAAGAVVESLELRRLLAADLAVTVADSPDPVTAGTNVTYLITLENNGPDVADNVSLTDAIPAGATFVSFTAPAGWTATTPPVGGTGTVTATHPGIATGAPHAFTLVANVNANTANGATLADTANVTSTTVDSDLGNNTDTETTAVITQADVSVTIIEKTGDPVTAGANETYTITIANAGPSDAQSVVLSNFLPLDTVAVSFSQMSGPAFALAFNGTDTFTATAATLAAGAVATFDSTTTVSASLPNGSVITETAEVVSTTSDPNVLNNFDSESTTVVVPSADLVLTMTDTPDPVFAGSTLLYEIKITNVGPASAQDVVVHNLGPAGLTFSVAITNIGALSINPDQSVTLTIANLAAGATADFSVAFFIPLDHADGAVLTNTVEMTTGTEDPDLSNNGPLSVTTTVIGRPVITITAPPPTSEGDLGGTLFPFTFTLNHPFNQIVELSMATADLTAIGGADYTSIISPASLQFFPGQTTKTVNVTVLGDTAFEPNEQFRLVAGDAINATFANTSATATILNDDPAPAPPPQVSINDVTQAEGTGGSTAFTFNVTLDAPSITPVTVNFATADGTANAPADYLSLAGTITFNPGEVSKPITVTVNADADAIVEDDETFAVNLSGVSANAQIADSQGVGTIISDEPRLIASGRQDLSASKKPKRSFSGVVASFRSIDFTSALNFAATINWGDGTSSAGQIVFNAQTQHWDVIGTHTYKKSGTYTLFILISDTNGATAVANSKLKA